MSSHLIGHPRSRSWTHRLAARAVRRELVVAWIICCLAFLALGLAEIKGVIWLIVIALAVVVDVLLFIATRRVADLPASALDERERTVRDRAYSAAYRIVFWGITLIVGGGLLFLTTGNAFDSSRLAHPAAHPELISGLGLATLQVVSLLPTAIVAWTERDEPGDPD